MHVPFVDLGRQNGALSDELLPVIDAVLHRGDFVLGSEVTRFEEAFASRVGVRFAVGVNSGLDALLLSLQALDMVPGDEVITVPNSYVATAAAIALAGGTPVFVDVAEDENIDVDQVEALINQKTRAIMPVHLRGRPAKMEPLVRLAKQHGVPIVEDAAQAIDARFQSQLVGTFGVAGCFSLHPLKNLGACGDGGIVVTDDEALYRELLKLRNHGLTRQDLSFNQCETWAHNSRLDSTAAAILNVKLRYLDEWTARRRLIAAHYVDSWHSLPLVLPQETEDEWCVYHAFVIQTPQRDALKHFLDSKGVETKIQYPRPLHLQPAAAHLGYHRGDFPVTERQCDQVLTVPVYPELSDLEVEYITESVHAYFDESALAS